MMKTRAIVIITLMAVLVRAAEPVPPGVAEPMIVGPTEHVLAWDASPSPGVEVYQVWMDGEPVWDSTTTNVTVTIPDDGVPHRLSVLAVGTNQLVSALSEEIVIMTVPPQIVIEEKMPYGTVTYMRLEPDASATYYRRHNEWIETSTNALDWEPFIRGATGVENTVLTIRRHK